MQSYFVDIYAMLLVTANLLLSTTTVNSIQEVTYRIREHPKPYHLIGNLFQSAGILETVRHVRLDSLESEWLEWFQIDRQTGDLFTRPEATTRLDHEKLCRVTLPNEHFVNPGHACKINLLASVNKKLLVKVTFVILDINDNAPVFIGSELKAGEKELMLDETSMPNVTKLQLPRAFDADSGGHKHLFYYMNPTSDHFRLVHLSERSDSAGGTEELYLLLTKQLDYEKVPTFRFNLTACDTELVGRVSNEGERHCNSLPIHITVINTNDEKPVFENRKYSVVIKETIPVHHQILTVKASDADYPPFNQINYHMIPDRKLSHELFLVDKLTGVVTLAKQLPGPGVYQFQIMATNEEISLLNHSVVFTPLRQLTDYFGDVTTVSVHVLDTNDHPPEITLQKSAETKDYLLNITNPEVQGFVPNDRSVFLCVTENIRSPVTLAYFLISDEDTDENAEINCTLLNSEYASGDFYVYSGLRLNMVSKMSTYKSVFRLTLETSIDAETFVPNKLLKLNSMIPQESRVVGFTDLSILCRDNGTPSLTGYVKIYVGVNDVDEFYPEVTINVLSNRAFLSNSKVEDHSYMYNMSLWEDLEVGTVFLRLNITDRDAISLPRLRTSLSSNNLEANETTGELFITNLYDYESQKFDMIRLTVHELGANSELARATVCIHIVLLDINDNSPVFTIPPLETTSLQPPPLYKRNEKFDGIRTMVIEEEQPVNTSLGRIFAVDADTYGNGEIIFFLAEVSPVIYKPHDTEQFVNNEYIPKIVIGKNGVLWSRHKLDREKTPLIDILVGAHDLGEPRLTTYTSLRIILKDINDHAPVWQFPTPTDFLVKVLKSSLSVNSTITRIRATDLDDAQQNARLSYSLMPHSNTSGNFESDISLACYVSQKFLTVHSQSGEIKTTNSLSKLPAGFMDVWLVVTDHGVVPRQSISKLVLYLADSPSQFSEDQLPLSYQQPSNWIVTKIRAIKSSNLADVLDSLTGTSGKITYLQHNSSLPMFVAAAASSFLFLFVIVCTVLLLGIRRRTIKRVKEKRTECSQSATEGPHEKSMLRQDLSMTPDFKPNTLVIPAFTKTQRACDERTEAGNLESVVFHKRNFSVSHSSRTTEVVDCSCTETRNGNIIKLRNTINSNDSLPTACATSTSAVDLSTSAIPLSIVTVSPEVYSVAACVTDMEIVHSEMLKFPNLFTSVVPVCHVPPDFIPSDQCEKRRQENPSVFNLKPVLFTQNMEKSECLVSLNVPLQNISNSHEND
ncbi:hypothetical protein P879_03385 [Paragonimus westermani]|uniref:Cadherin domain-containing protein n=1 Tax=Paragonimus westermani TaxID=34504 RepID=A0A8T0DTA3_9TREM|nr:hypothetical protein P879_03385 [Paragonimus westermani]